MNRQGTAERRAHPRYPVDLGAELLLGQERLDCRVRDLSEGGAFLSRPATNFNPAPATRCRLDCVLPPPVDAVVQLEVEIVRQSLRAMISFGGIMVVVSAALFPVIWGE